MVGRAFGIATDTSAQRLRQRFTGRELHNCEIQTGTAWILLMWPFCCPSEDVAGSLNGLWTLGDQSAYVARQSF